MSLVLILFLPVAVGLAGFFFPRGMTGLVGWWALLGSLVSLGLAIALLVDFDSASGALQEVVNQSWIPQLGVSFQLGVDGLSIFLVLLTSLLWAAAIGWSALQGPDRPRNYFFMLGLAQTATLGAFWPRTWPVRPLLRPDADPVLLPDRRLGHGRPGRGDDKIVIYTLVGSLLMLAAAIATGDAQRPTRRRGHVLDRDLRQAPLPTGSQYWIFAFFAAAFLVKMPAFPLHGWMPDAYRACRCRCSPCSPACSRRSRAYGFLRIVLPLYPDAAVHFQD